MNKLRDYQWELIERARALMYKGCRSLVIQAPTGAGKTLLTAHMLSEAEKKGKTAWFICHRRELINQARAEFKNQEVDTGVIAAGYDKTKHNIQICSIQTLARRINTYNDTPDLVVWDECHHVAARSWAKIKAKLPRAYHIGLTATPERLDGKGLGQYFDELIQGPSVRTLIDQGYLSDYKIYAPPLMNTAGIRKIAGDFDRNEVFNRFQGSQIMGDIVKEYEKYSYGKQALAFGTMIKHSEIIEMGFNMAGHRCFHVDGETPKKCRDDLVSRFEREEYPIITNCELFSEGFDVCGIHTVLLCRPTYSMALYRQQIGRALRPHPGKVQAILIDFTGNVHRHGLPDDDIEWSLEGRKARETTRSPFRMCKQCYFVQPIKYDRCQDCKALFPVKPKKLPRKVKGELIEFNAEVLRKKRRVEQGRCKDLASLVELGKRRGYRNPYFWGLTVWKARKKKK